MVEAQRVETPYNHESRSDPYFALIHGEAVRESNIQKFAPYAMETVDVLMREGLIFGQGYLFESDKLLFFIRQTSFPKPEDALKKAIDACLGIDRTIRRKQ